MFINDNLKTATIDLGTVAAGSIGTAVATVDIASSFKIAATIANTVYTLPNPTDALAGDRVRIYNNGTVAISILGTTIPAASFAHFMWTGTTWAADANAGRNSGASVLVAAVPAGNSTVAHNLDLPGAGNQSKLIFRAYDSTGKEVIFARNKAADTATLMGITSTVALTNITFDIVPLV